MNLTAEHLEAIRVAALPVKFGSVTIKTGTDKHLDLIVEDRHRLDETGLQIPEISSKNPLDNPGKRA
jgi:hypothetical protein